VLVQERTNKRRMAFQTTIRVWIHTSTNRRRTS